MKLQELAHKLACRLDGDPSLEIHGVAGIDHAVAGQLTFLANRRYSSLLKFTRASAVLLDDAAVLSPDRANPALATLRTSNPYLAFAQALELFYHPPVYQPGIHPTAVIAPSAKIGERAHIGPYCFIDENVQLGPHAVLHSFVTLYRDAKIGSHFFAHAHAVVREGCLLGDRVILQNGAIVGGDGLGYAKRADGTWHKIVQSGPAVLEDDVEVQANACIDRATVGETRVARGTKIDDLVLVGHASQVGPDTMLCGQVGLAGSTKIGANCILAGQVGTAGHLTVGDHAVITAQSGVPNDVPAHALYSGYPAVDNHDWLKMMAALHRLPDLLKRVQHLETQLHPSKK
jgi:UDP-3-O-[3-hydroxymyristoyl] glucosamine N-acyltransferase